MSLRRRRFDSNWPVLNDPDQIGDTARVVAVVLLPETGFERRRMPRIDANHWPAMALQPGKTTKLRCNPDSTPIRSIVSACRL